MTHRIYITPDTLHQFFPDHRFSPLEQAFYDAIHARETILVFGGNRGRAIDEMTPIIACARVFFGEERASAIYDLAYEAVQQATRASSAERRHPRVIDASAVMHPAFLSPRVEQETTTPSDPLYDPSLFPYGDGAEAGTSPQIATSWFADDIATYHDVAFLADGTEAGTSSGVELSYADVMRLAYTNAFLTDGAEAGTSATPTAKPSSDGRRAGTPSRPDGRETGPFSGIDGGQAGYSYTGLNPDPAIADGWRSGRHVARDGAGAGTPLEAAGHTHNDGAGAGTPWHPLDDVAVDGRWAGTPDQRQAGRHLARFLAQKKDKWQGRS